MISCISVRQNFSYNCLKKITSGFYITVFGPSQGYPTCDPLQILKHFSPSPNCPSIPKPSVTYVPIVSGAYGKQKIPFIIHLNNHGYPYLCFYVSTYDYYKTCCYGVTVFLAYVLVKKTKQTDKITLNLYIILVKYTSAILCLNKIKKFSRIDDLDYLVNITRIILQSLTSSNGHAKY